MMHFEYDPVVVEQATFLFARGDANLQREVHLVVDPLYELPDSEQRQEAFQQAFRTFFMQIGLAKVLSDLIEERPLISKHVGKCIVREAARRKDEAAELFVHASAVRTTPAHRTLVISVCPDSFIDAENLASRMRRELLHVADMLDEDFAYDREAITGLSPLEKLIRDRYRVLWDLYVEGRLGREGQLEPHSSTHAAKPLGSGLQGAFGQVFPGYNRYSCQHAFDRVCQAAILTHGQLLDWAANPETLFYEPVGTLTGAQRKAGERCPLCGFPTHDWYEFHDKDGGAAAAGIRENHADWTPACGACRQCTELYGASNSVRTGINCR